MIRSIRLSRNDIQKIYEIMERFEKQEYFEIKEERTSGIGSSTLVRFKDSKDESITTEIDITDYSLW